MILKESLEVNADSNHASSQSVDTGLDCFLVTTGCTSWHFLRGLLDLFRFVLNQGEAILDLDVDTADLFILRCEKRDILLHYDTFYYWEFNYLHNLSYLWFRFTSSRVDSQSTSCGKRLDVLIWFCSVCLMYYGWLVAYACMPELDSSLLAALKKVYVWQVPRLLKL